MVDKSLVSQLQYGVLFPVGKLVQTADGLLVRSCHRISPHTEVLTLSVVIISGIIDVDSAAVTCI